MKRYVLKCPDCDEFLIDTNDLSDIIGKSFICDGAHDDVIQFTGQIKHIHVEEDSKPIYHNKLVRDRIPEIIELDGNSCEYHIADDGEFERLLHAKLLEEANEFIQKPSAEELADILEVVDALRKHHKIDITELKHQKIMKKTNRGGFEKKIILDSTKKNVEIDEKYQNK